MYTKFRVIRHLSTKMASTPANKKIFVEKQLLTFVTGNKGKLKEVNAILGSVWPVTNKKVDRILFLLLSNFCHLNYKNNYLQSNERRHEMAGHSYTM